MTLRTGITTGTCAAACAYVAAYNLIEVYSETSVDIMTPAGKLVSVEIADSYKSGDTSWCFVRKDSGDDPDITNGTLVGCGVRFLSQNEHEPEELKGYREKNMLITGGRGIGTVTKNGLSCPVGYPAINPVPRKMIFSSVENAFSDLKSDIIIDQGVMIEVTIPDGETLALKTFNPNLGIVGGLSVLGTSGIVNPMSEDALVETIRLDIRTKVCEGKKNLIMVPGNYGEEFLKSEYQLNPDDFVKCSNYVGKTVRMMADEGVEKLLFTGHIGKLIKVAGGIMNTHSKYGDHRMEILHSFICKVDPSYLDSDKASLILGMNTTDEACNYLEEAGLLKQVMRLAAEAVKENIEKEVQGKFTCEVILFNKIQGLLARV